MRHRRRRSQWQTIGIYVLGIECERSVRHSDSVVLVVVVIVE